MSNNTGGPAFPNWPESAFPSTFKSADPETGQVHRWGMTLRDYFAAKAMQALLSEDRYMGLIGVNNFEHRRAEDAYKVADAMLRARQE